MHSLNPCRFILASRLSAIVLAVMLTMFISLPARPDQAAAGQMEVPEQPADTIAADSSLSLPKRRATVTPVDIDREKPQQPVLHYYDRHGNPLEEPVLFLAELDTVRKVSAASPYPLYNGVSVGFNFADAVMLLAGQHHAAFDLWAEVSLHNWFFPVVEAGLGYGSLSPEEGNYNYKAKLSPYFKLGLNYNFLYKSNPDYQAFVGLRAGFSSFRWDVTDIVVSDPYWGQQNSYSITDQSATCFYGEALGGIKVKLWKRLSMGWTMRYKFKFHTSSKIKPGDPRPGSDPWYVPGYGASSPVGFTFSLIYTLPGPRLTPLVPNE